MKLPDKQFRSITSFNLAVTIINRCVYLLPQLIFRCAVQSDPFWIFIKIEKVQAVEQQKNDDNNNNKKKTKIKNKPQVYTKKKES